MNNVLEVLKDFFTQSKMKTFYWQTANGFVVILIGTLASLKPDELSGYSVLVVAGALAALNGLTKFINKTYLTK